MPATPADRAHRRSLGTRIAAAVVLAVVVLGVARATAAAASVAVTPAPSAAAGSVALPLPAAATARAEGDGQSGSPSEPKLSPIQAVILGVVEGVTEFLPISSTGHLLVTSDLLGVGTGSPEEKEAADAYAIVIQAGAILAVVVLYWRRLLSMVNGLLGRDPDGRQVLINLVVAFVPAVVVGVALESEIKDRLFGPWPVVAAWAVGGALLLWLSSGSWWERQREGTALEHMGWRQALIIGLVQCLAMWPGTSRSLVVLVAAILVGMSLAAAVEFSFLLGLVTLSAATLYDGAKHGGVIVDQFGVAAPVIGFVTAFIAAVIAVRWMVSYLQNHSLAIFGWYRLGVAAVTAVLVFTSVIEV
jgi:undecaprenyl-diphosphatase